jgi:aminoglycoside phosphotransferase (APT) family kinase protein
MHADQLEVPPELVRALLDEQFPRWAGLPVTPVEAEGTVNAIFRVGDRLAARFPLRAGDPDAVAQGLRAEADAARELAAHTRFPVPEPVALGRPGHGYPVPWSVQTWLPGATATQDDPGASEAFAHDLAELIADVRSIDTRGRTFSGQARGGELRAHDEWVQTCFRRSEGLLDVPRLRRLWSRLRDLPRTSPDAMTHGDLIPGNVLVAGGRLAGVLDVGGLVAADPALDLVGAWHLLDAGRRELVRADLGCDDLEWERGAAWAFVQAVGLVWYYVETNRVMSGLGRRTLERVVAGMPVGSRPDEIDRLM